MDLDEEEMMLTRYLVGVAAAGVPRINGYRYVCRSHSKFKYLVRLESFCSHYRL